MILAYGVEISGFCNGRHVEHWQNLYMVPISHLCSH